MTDAPLAHPRTKPTYRGISHLIAFYAALAITPILVGFATSGRATLAALVYGLSLATMYGASALYHRTNPRPEVEKWLERADHAAIFVFIGGSYTPFCLALPEGGGVLAAIVWGLVVTGVLRAMFWVDAPHWLSTIHYLVVGWVIVPYLGEVWRVVGTKSIVLLAVGGVLYSIGAVVFARKGPNPLPGHFGFHEVFHAFVVAASLCHLAAVVHVIRLLGST